jgi:hypothetical protein
MQRRVQLWLCPLELTVLGGDRPKAMELCTCFSRNCSGFSRHRKMTEVGEGYFVWVAQDS